MISPDFAYLLLIIGILGVLFEITTPGTSFPGIIGIGSLLLSFFAFSFYEINYYGIGLIAIAFILFTLEVKFISYGVLTFLGTLSFIFGSYYLIDRGSEMQISLTMIITSAVVLICFVLVLLYLGLKAQQNRKISGQDGIIGKEGIVTQNISPKSTGEIKYMGELWKAESNEEIDKGATVIIAGIENLKLFVKKK